MQEMKYFNEGNDCDICKNQLMTGRDGTVEDCRRRQNGLSCRFEERDIRTCPVCEHEVDREDMYFTIREIPLMVDVPVYEMRENPDTGEQERVQVGTREVVNGERERLMIIQDRCMKQCRQGASDFGMTVSSRCRLVVPKAKETKPENKFAKYASS